MAVNFSDAYFYLLSNVIDIEDWEDADDEKKIRILASAEATLSRKFSDYIIPDNAVYEFANVLAIAYNDTNRLNKHGIAGFSITGVGSFNFKETLKVDDESLIPRKVYDMIGEANGVKLGGKRVRWTVL